MKDLDLSQVFCEILGGLAGIFWALGALDLSGLYSVRDSWCWASKYASFSGLTAFLVFSYLIGIIVDAFGLVFDKVITDHWELSKKHSGISRSEFYKSAEAHLFSYWKEQWTYFSCYRNLFMVMIPGLITWPLLVNKYLGCFAASVTFILSVIVAVVLWLAMQTLLKLYHCIPSHYSSSFSSD